MNDTTTKVAADGTVKPADRIGAWRHHRRWAFAVLGLGLLFETAVLAVATGRATELSHLTTLGLWLWWAIPFLLTGMLMLFASGGAGVSWWSTVGLAVAITLAGVGGYVQTRSSVDASLIGLSGPLVQDALVVVVAIVVIVAEVLARRRRHRDELTS